MNHTELINEFTYIASQVHSTDNITSESNGIVYLVNRYCFGLIKNLRTGVILSDFKTHAIYKTFLRVMLIYGQETWKLTKVMNEC